MVDAEAESLVSGELYADVPVTGLLLAGEFSEPVLVAIGMPLGLIVTVTVMVFGLLLFPLPDDPPCDGDEPLPLPDDPACDGDEPLPLPLLDDPA